MLEGRILATLHFFDLQHTPLTLFELHKFLLPELAGLRPNLNERFEVINESAPSAVTMGETLKGLDTLIQENKIVLLHGYYCLPGRESLITQRLSNYQHGIPREKLIRRFAPFLRHLPFVRGVAIGGSQAMGQQAPASDIDVLVITDPHFIWIARTAVTIYFQVFGVRRHGQKVANRFCLNHYVAGPHELDDERDPYNAMEYLRLRAIVYPSAIDEFLEQNEEWMRCIYPNTVLMPAGSERQSGLQAIFESILRTGFGRWLERRLGTWQLARIKTGEHAVATGEELSFHSKERKYQLLRQFFGS